MEEAAAEVSKVKAIIEVNIFDRAILLATNESYLELTMQALELLLYIEHNMQLIGYSCDYWL